MIYAGCVADVAANVRRNLADEVGSSGFGGTFNWILSSIFNWKVPKVAHPQPLDVALNNYANYARRQEHFSVQKNKWTRRKRKRVRGGGRNGQWRRHNSGQDPARFRHRTVEVTSSVHQPYYYEKPLSHIDVSQVYFLPSQRK